MDPGVLYDADYYHQHCGPVPYTSDSDVFKDLYARTADEILRSLAPRRVFDAGCALGFLVAALWDRSIEAYGRDISPFAISQVRPDIRAYCSVGSITERLPGHFDLVVCVEVLEHMAEGDAVAAIRVMTDATPAVLFSSTPADFDEPTHVNVHPTIYWLRHFAAHGFAPDPLYDASFISPQAMLLRRSGERSSDTQLATFAEIIRQRLERSTATAELAAKLSEVHAVLASEQDSWRSSENEWQRRLSAAEARARESTWLAQVGRFFRRLGRVAWWTLTLQLRSRLRQRRLRNLTASSLTGILPASTQSRDLLRQRFNSCEPLPAFPAPAAGRRISIVTDSVGEGALYGGVGTAIVIAALLAGRTGASLRLITRTEPSDLHRLKTVLDANGVTWTGDIEAIHAPPFSEARVPLTDGDYFLTTSWWTTRATVTAVPASKVFYLLQEDERMFYPRGDERLRCSETMNDSRIHLVINSELLFRHLGSDPEPLPKLQGRSVWFEPAFPAHLFFDDSDRRDGAPKRTFFFYARPHNLRNLYWSGLEAITLAIEQAVLDPVKWSFIFAGREIGPVVLPYGCEPTILENLAWDKYAEVVRSVDLGLSLMDTPHASYPPLDLAASGAVVVTNSCGIKTSLESYSANIITVAPDVLDLCEGMRMGTELVANPDRRRDNYAKSQIQRDWGLALEGALRQCIQWIEA